MGENAQERELEQGLVTHIRDFLLELGVGFSFVGSQDHLEVDSEDYYLDLLFYHLKLRCFIGIDLKMGEFQPEFTGKMNFYVSAVAAKINSERFCAISAFSRFVKNQEPRLVQGFQEPEILNL